LSVRYPRDNAPAASPPLDEVPRIEYGTWEVLRRGHGLAILAVGTMVDPALEAARQLALEGIDSTVVNCRFLKPIDEKTLSWVLDRHAAVLSVEEGTIVNGFGAMIARTIASGDRRGHGHAIDVMGVPDEIFDHASRAEQLTQAGLTPQHIAARGRALAERGRIATARETA
jgi:1-deoxy-D-xylulose-5-phosphate synthase